MNKLWAFGCSHVKGHELGNSGWDGWNEDLSFTGAIAKNLNLKQENQAQNGVGIDYCFDQFLKLVDIIDWDKDLVIFSAPNPLRWQNDKDEVVQLSNVFKEADNSSAKFFLETMPAMKSFHLYHWAILNYIKLAYPKTIIILFYPWRDPLKEIFRMSRFIDKSNKKLYQEYSFKYFNDLTIKDFASGKPNEFQYPGGHYFESKHKEFADYLTNKITSNGFYKNTF